MILPRPLVWLFPAVLCLAAGCTRPPGGKTELLYSFWGSVEQQKVEREIVAAFEKENPDIRVQLLPIGQRYPEKIQAMMVGKIAPDVMMVDMTSYDEWAARGVLKDVTGLVGKLEKEDELMPLPARCFKRDGHYYAIPTSAHGFIAYCNLDALRAAGIPFSPGGWTWDEMLAMSPKLTRATNPQSLTEYAMLMPPIDALFACFGVRLLDDLRHPTRVTADRPETVAAFSFYRKLYTSDFVVPHDVASDQGTYQLFRDGRVAFFFSGRWSTPEFAGKTSFAWDVAPFPAGPAGAVTMHGGSGLAISSETRHSREAERFLEFCAGPKGAAISMRGKRTVPVYRNLSHSAEFLTLTPPASLERFRDTMEDGGALIQFYGPGYGDLYRLSIRCLHRIVFRNDPVENSVKILQKDLERWLERRNRQPVPGNPAK